MAGFWKKITTLLGMGSATAEATQFDGEDQVDAYWQQVYDARERYFIEHVGQLPEQILKIGHMFGVWPGGGLYVIPAKKISEDAWVYTTFGFSNADMPASASVSDVSTQADELGRMTRTQSTLKAKEKAVTSPESAGYGYELFVLTRENAQWPLWILQWSANAEILNDAGLLERVTKYGGLTIEDVQVGEDDYVNLLIAKSRTPLPTGTKLPNGKMELLIATVVTEDEMRWSIEHGREALLDKLVAAGVGQFSLRERDSVVS